MVECGGNVAGMWHVDACMQASEGVCTLTLAGVPCKAWMERDVAWMEMLVKSKRGTARRKQQDERRLVAVSGAQNAEIKCSGKMRGGDTIRRRCTRRPRCWASPTRKSDALRRRRQRGWCEEAVLAKEQRKQGDDLDVSDAGSEAAASGACKQRAPQRRGTFAFCSASVVKRKKRETRGRRHQAQAQQ